MHDSLKIPLVAVIGHPVAHSKSPRLHGYWLRKYAIAGHYIPIDVAPDGLADALQTLPKLGFVGANVTIPHKEAAFTLASQISDRAALIGAANTVSFQDNGRFYADNTDGYGFLANIRQHAPEWQPSDGPVAVLGAGGAARAVICALLGAGAPKILLSNRSRHRAESLRADFGARIDVVDWNLASEMLASAATLVNTTAAGMDGKPELRVSLDALSPDALVTDLVYTPLRTQLLEAAAQKGCRTVDGLGMLLHQAVPGFERWFGVKPEVDEETRRVMLEV